MALIKCHECGTEVSTEAAACPKCGAKPKQAKPPMSNGMKLTLMVMGAGVIAAAVQSGHQAENEAAKPPEQKAVEAKEDALRAQRVSAAAGAMKLIKKNLRNPESVQWEDALANDDGTLLCISYRAQNGFGGYNREAIAFVSGRAHTDAATWNKRCAANKSLKDVKRTALHFIE